MDIYHVNYLMSCTCNIFLPSLEDCLCCEIYQRIKIVKKCMLVCKEEQ